MKTANLTIQDYHPMKKPWSVQQAIQERVERESWASVDIPMPPIPEYTPTPKTKLTLAGAHAFMSDMIESILP